MMTKEFKRQLLDIALPITIQSVLSASLSLIDQIMIGSLGSICIAGIGLAGKFTSLFSVTISAVVTVAGILIAQYRGGRNERGVSDSFFCTMHIAMFMTILFGAVSLFFPIQIMGLYATDEATITQAAIYLRLLVAGFIPQTVTLFLSTMLRNYGEAKLPAVAGGISIITNTLLNYVFIFGWGPVPRMEVAGAAIATSLARVIELALVLAFFVRVKRQQHVRLWPRFCFGRRFVSNVMHILLPILLSEFLWSLGENVYAAIYGHLGTEAFAAMALMYPIQGLVIGALSGVAGAAGIIIGASLGRNDHETAYSQAKEFVRLTIALGLCLAVFVILIAPFYVRLFHVVNTTRQTTVFILYAFALVFCAKVYNMVIGAGVLKSGGQTRYMLAIDSFGTWCVGVPLGLVTAYLLRLPIYWVYFILSLEEYVRVALSVVLFRSRRWMKNITT